MSSARVDSGELPPWRIKTKKMKKVLNIIAEIKAHALDRYLIVIFTLWHW